MKMINLRDQDSNLLWETVMVGSVMYVGVLIIEYATALKVIIDVTFSTILFYKF